MYTISQNQSSIFVYNIHVYTCTSTCISPTVNVCAVLGTTLNYISACEYVCGCAAFRLRDYFQASGVPVVFVVCVHVCVCVLSFGACPKDSSRPTVDNIGCSEEESEGVDVHFRSYTVHVPTYI